MFMHRDVNPLTPFGFMVMLVQDRRARAATAPDRGASAMEWVIISALLIVIAVTVGGIIMTKVRDKANDLDLTTP